MSSTRVKFDSATGLAPAVVQDAATRRVLMLGYVSPESLRLTIETGEVHFWSRSRSEIWRKGATSGNTFRVREIALDCDADAVLLSVTPSGPACHAGTESCFDAVEESEPSYDSLARLWKVVAQRAATRPSGSYTADLVSRGVDAAARKVVEEATEVLLAARDHVAGGAPTALYEESADLVYHLFVLLAERGVDPGGVLAELDRRARPEPHRGTETTTGSVSPTT